MGVVTGFVDSLLGRWAYSEWQPLPGTPLSAFVERVWHFDGVTTHRRERVFPTGRVDLIVHLDERYRLVEGAGTAICGTTCVTGLQSAPIVVESPERPCRVLGVRLYPAGAYAVLARPLDEMSGLTVDLPDLVGRAADELAEQCHAVEVEEIFPVVARWVAERIARSPAADPAIAWIAAQIERREGAVSIAALRERTGLTKTRLATGFREQIGVTPKLYARILRFRRALAMVNEGTAPLAEIALAAGYYDQPHLNAEFRELGGLAPREFLAAQRYERSVSLAEASA